MVRKVERGDFDPPAPDTGFAYINGRWEKTGAHDEEAAPDITDSSETITEDTTDDTTTDETPTDETSTDVTPSDESTDAEPDAVREPDRKTAGTPDPVSTSAKTNR